MAIWEDAECAIVFAQIDAAILKRRINVYYGFDATGAYWVTDNDEEGMERLDDLTLATWAGGSEK
jgi:hypothetical protein